MIRSRKRLLFLLHQSHIPPHRHCSKNTPESSKPSEPSKLSQPSKPSEPSKPSKPSKPPTYTPPKLKVSVLGAAGGIGQPLSLLLKHSNILTDLSLYDIVGAPGVGTDLSHIETRVKVKGYMGAHLLATCLENADVVLIPAGIPRKPGMTRDDLFKTNASIIYELAYACAESCPKAVVGIISNPVNSTVPIFAEVYKKIGVFKPELLFGITTLDVVRANTFIGEAKGLDPAHVYCPVIGGHSPGTMIPVLSQTKPKLEFTPDEISKLTERIQEAGTEVVKAKEGMGSATLSMAYAAARFCYSLMRAMRGEQNVIECGYIKTDAHEAPYFATQVILGPNGVEKKLALGKLNAFEKELMKKALPVLQQNIEKGEKFVKDKEKK